MNPKYQIVAEALRDGILDGTYQKTLPTEQALCAQFQVSRQTVRQALSLLETERLIDRRIQTGVDPEAATRFVDFSDMPNVRLCLQKTAAADLQLRIDRGGDYHRVSGGTNESH